MNGLPKGHGKPAVQTVEWRIGEDDAADRSVTFETNCAHPATPIVIGRMGQGPSGVLFILYDCKVSPFDFNESKPHVRKI
jgi:hypothetical protein